MAAEILPKGGEQYKAEAGGVDISPEQRDQLENYIDNMMLLIHKQPAADKIIEGLQRVKNPQAAIAVTANEVNEMLLRGFQENGKQYNNVTLFYGSYFLVKELIELGEILVGRLPGRREADDITLFESQGLAVQDLALAVRLEALARARGLGVELPYGG